jgi:hypothetical protein
LSAATLSGISLRAYWRTISGTHHLADAVAGEVDADGQPGAGVGDWLDQDLDSRPDRAVYTPDAPGLRRVDVHELVDGRLAPPMRRVVTHLAPTAGD